MRIVPTQLRRRTRNVIKTFVFAGGRRGVLPDAARKLSLHIPPVGGDMAPGGHGRRQGRQVEEKDYFVI